MIQAVFTLINSITVALQEKISYVNLRKVYTTSLYRI